MKRFIGPSLLLAFLLCIPVSAAHAQKLTPKQGVPYSYGDYTLFLNEDNVASLYADDGAFAMEFVDSSNGYWGLLSDEYEYTVWSVGTLSDDTFYWYPWEETLPKAVAIKDGSYFTLSADDNTTKFLFSKGNVIVTMSDGGVLTIPSKGRTISFLLNDQSDTYTYPDQIDELYEAPEEDYSEDSYVPELSDVGLIGRRVKISDAGKIYPMINTTELLSFPDQETKTLAGAGSWGKWKPKKGDIGTVIWQSQHADTGSLVCIVVIAGNYICIGDEGLETTSEQLDAVPFIESYQGYQ